MRCPAFVQSPRPLALLVAATLLIGGCAWVQNTRDRISGIQLDTLRAADGAQVSVLTADVPKARHMTLGAGGTLFVGSSAGDVYALTLNGASVAKRRTIISGLTHPSGVAFAGGSLFVADRTRILRFDRIEEQLDNPGKPVVVIDGLPDEKRHDAHAMRIGPDRKLYVSIGAPCDTCEAVNDEYGTIVRVNLDGSGREVVARGIRNTVGFDWHPRTGELWFTDNGSDELGPDLPNDELNRVSRTGENFGFPYCHQGDIPDPHFGAKRPCSEFTGPALKLGAHVAALGLRFDAPAAAGAASGGGSEPSMIIARRGSHPPIRVGYDVVRVSLQAGSAPRMEPFLTGFLQGRKFWGRPVDVLVMADRSVLISDDLNGAIYRVSRTR